MIFMGEKVPKEEEPSAVTITVSDMDLYQGAKGRVLRIILALG